MVQDLSRLNALRKVFSRTQAAAINALTATAAAAPAAPSAPLLVTGLDTLATLGFNPARAGRQRLRWTLSSWSDFGSGQYGTPGALSLPMLAGDTDLLTVDTAAYGTPFGMKNPGLYQISGMVQVGWAGPPPNHARITLGVEFNSAFRQGLDWAHAVSSYPPQTIFRNPSNAVAATDESVTTPVFYVTGPSIGSPTPCRLSLKTRHQGPVPVFADLAGVAGPVVVDFTVYCLDATG